MMEEFEPQEQQEDFAPARYRIVLPEDDYDEDDEVEERVLQAQKREKERVKRGNFRAI